MKTSFGILGSFCFAIFAAAVSPARGQSSATWLGDGSTNFNNGNWSNSALWNPHVVPNGNYNVTIAWDPNGAPFNGPELDTNITIQNLTTVNRVFLDNQAFPGTNLTVNGTTALTTAPGHDGESPALFDAGGTWLLGTLSNYDSVAHTLNVFFFPFNGATIGFRNADVWINQGTLIIGANSRIIDQNNSLSAIRNLSQNDGGFTIADGNTFTTAGSFTNNGGLSVTTGNSAATVMTISGSLTNFDSASKTLTNGSYDVEVTSTSGSATLKFPNADIRTLSNAQIKLVGAGASITDLNGFNALRNLSGVQNSALTSAGMLTITPSGGTFTNDNSNHTIDNGANITIQGNHQSTNNGVTNLGAPTDSSNTTLTINGSSIIDGGGLDLGGQPGVNTQYHTELHVINGLEFRGAYLTGTGTTFADVGLIQGSVLNPGHSPGQLTFQGKLTLDDTTTSDMQIGGTSAGDEFDRVVQNGGLLTIGGKLLISFTNDFEYAIRHDESFDIFTSSQNLAGAFANAASGARVVTNDGKGTFIVTYDAMDKVTLSEFLPPPRVVRVTNLPNQHLTIYFNGYPNSSYELQASPDLNPDNFETIAGVTTGAGADYTLFATEDVDSSSYGRRFYRIVYPNADESKKAGRRPRFALAANRGG